MTTFRSKRKEARHVLEGDVVRVFGRYRRVVAIGEEVTRLRGQRTVRLILIVDPPAAGRERKYLWPREIVRTRDGAQ